MRQIQFKKMKKSSNLREVVVDGSVAGVAMIQDPRDGYRGLVARRVVFEPWAALAGRWGGKQRIFPNLTVLREWLQSAEA